MTFRQIYTVTNDRIVIILPNSFKDKQVMVTVDDEPGTQTDNMRLMKQAATDPLYMADLNEVNDDFNNIDHETL